MQRYGAVYFHAQVGSSGPLESQELALQIAGDFSPWVEQAGMNLVVMDLSGLSRQWPDEKVLARTIVQKFQDKNLLAQIAISSNRATARLVASGTAGTSIILPGQEKEFLAPLPLALLEAPLEIGEVFDRWGLRTLGDLANLPEKALAQRLDEKGMELYRQACGEDATPLLPHTPIETFEVFYAFDWPLENSESLAFTLNHLLDRLCRRLDSRSLVAEAVSLSMNLADGSENARHIRFGFPLNDAATILSLVRLDLEARPPQAAIESLLLRLYPAPPRPVQFSLVEPPMIPPEKLARTLARLCALVGDQNVGSPALLDTYRPDAFEMRPFDLNPPQRLHRRGGRQTNLPLRNAECGMRNKENRFTLNGNNSSLIPHSAFPIPQSEVVMALRIFRPSLQARVKIERVRPVSLESPVASGNIIECGGPWRTSGEWWKKDQRWAWDEWDVLLNNGQLYRLYRDLSTEQWFVFGAYD
ncbi:MAG TPA: hypothetical protein VGK99_04665 [Acidobacteriota bacterium]